MARSPHATQGVIAVTAEHAVTARRLREQHGDRAEEILSHQIANARSSCDSAALARLAGVFCALVELKREPIHQTL